MNELFQQAVTLMVAGMGFVFVFLAMLVGATNLMSKVVNRLAPEIQVVPPPTAGNPTPPPNNNNDTMAVIAAAIAKHRSRHKK
ncbi:OadG family transporter subunit [Hahella aquimaris]|uniref:OadG family protein n=1 Tax=Hahella sp. HNIBRBA332 TaxID=3015983 RepID=UPI00273B5720|nr:OadG family transporter subunit [Hahella sp. HNIBRBA332]WLQ14691.1 OadG family transporter subunit [Hahella sp. HNIBRBA332]